MHGGPWPWTTERERTMLAEKVEGFRASPQQEHLWRLAEGVTPDTAGVYGARCLLAVDGALDEAVLRRALRDLISRHEILRTLLDRLPGFTLPLQVIGPAGEPDLEVHDLAGLSAGDRERCLQALRVSAPGVTPDRGPILRARLLRLSRARHLLELALPALHADSASLIHLA